VLGPFRKNYFFSSVLSVFASGAGLASFASDLAGASAFTVSVASFVVISIYLTKYFNNHGLWLSLLLFMILRSLTLNIFFKKILRKF